MRKWWDELLESGPALGYFPNAKKCWLIVKPEQEQAAREMFRDTAINITVEGHKHLGAALGSRSFLEEYVGEKVDEWVTEVTELAELAISQPQASYAAFTFGLAAPLDIFPKNITGYCRSTRATRAVFIPAVTDHTVTEVECDLLGLPVHMGGLGFTDPVVASSSEYEASIKVTDPLVRRIIEQEHQPPVASEIQTLQLSTRKQNDDCLSERKKNSLPTKAKRAVELTSEKGSSNWLTMIPLKELDYNLNKKEFRDAIKLRYDWEITDTPMICACGVQFSVDHAMVCQHGGFIIQRHNELHDLEAEMLGMVCNDVEVQPVLQEVTGETLNHGANKVPDARLDIHARGFWERQRSAFFDVRVCHPNADSYRDLTPKQIYKKHENEKKRQYAERVMEIEQGTFTLLVFTTTGGMADECVKYNSRFAELIANKKGESYSSAISWIRARVPFAILCSAILCLRGSRSRRRKLDFVDSDLQIENIRVCPN